LGIPREVALFSGNSRKMLFHSPQEISGNSNQFRSFGQMESAAGFSTKQYKTTDMHGAYDCQKGPVGLNFEQ